MGFWKRLFGRKEEVVEHKNEPKKRKGKVYGDPYIEVEQ